MIGYVSVEFPLDDVSNERGLLGSQWEVQIVFSHLYVSMYMRKIGAFLSFFDYNVRESWNCLELLFYTSFTSNFQLSKFQLCTSSPRVLLIEWPVRLKKKPLCKCLSHPVTTHRLFNFRLDSLVQVTAYV